MISLELYFPLQQELLLCTQQMPSLLAAPWRVKEVLEELTKYFCRTVHNKTQRKSKSNHKIILNPLEICRRLSGSKYELFLKYKLKASFKNENQTISIRALEIRNFLIRK